MMHTGVSKRALRQSARCGAFVIVFLCWAPPAIVLNAEQLVRRATNAEDAQLAPTIRVQERFMPVGPGQPLAAAYRSSLFGQMPPLSMAAVAAFRAQHHRDTTDRVELRAHEGRVTLKTIASHGDPHEIELTLEAETHRLVRAVLVFPGLGRVEIEALANANTRPEYFPAARPSLSTAGAFVVPRLPSRDDLDKAELKARLVLGQRGMDMGRAVQVSRTPEAVRVHVEERSLTTLTLAERRAAAARLAEIALVRLDFSTATMPSAFTPAPAAPAAAGAAAAAARFRLSQWLHRTFADARTRARFGPALMQSLDTVRQRLTVLADLSDRYPDPRRQLSATTRPLLQQLVDLEYHRLRTELNESRELISTLSGTAHAAFDAHDTPPRLLARAPHALSHAKAFEQLVRDSTASQDDLTDDDRQRLNAGFAALWQAVYGPSPWRR